ncbi:extracellular solute-binding protein [Halorientalis regularis]|uniref:Spermidine/putrescine transport system substrate-binding protein n=1 Tax=Halorientalis regularis TaxID=660518 RepID=A0A1G7GG76_9EURY|nr:extracellular solute-binding protein [Halorientalis regularis]SDE87162.1 spermidine/putrescine transport system substrate-binding protein [Halorientalis regularis]
MTESGRRSLVSRRAFLATGAATATALAGCVGSGGGSDTLRVSTWSGTNKTVFENVVKPKYEDETGNSLEVVGNWSGIVPKVRQSPEDSPPFDVTIGGSRITYRGNQDDLWEPVRYDNLSNSDKLKDRLMQYEAAKTAVPVSYGVHAYVYNKDATTWTPETWSDIVSDEASNVTLSSAFWLKNLMMAAVIDDSEPLAQEVYDRQNADALFDLIEEVPTTSFYQGAQDLWTKLNQGIANVGHYFFAYGLAKAASSDKLNIGVTVPPKTTGYIDYYHVVRGSGKREMAEEFLDFLISSELQTAYAKEFNLGMSNTNTEYPEQTREQLPTSNDELGDVGFRDFARVADYSSELNKRYRKLVQNN